jgi:hypothetical protein
MYTLIAACLLAIIVGSCIYGKKFWDERLSVLVIAAVLMLVSLTSATMITRKNLPTKVDVWKMHSLNTIYVQDSILNKSQPAAISKYKSVNFNKVDGTYFAKKVIVTKKLVAKNTYKNTYRFASQRKSTIFVYAYDGDTLVGFVKNEDGKKVYDFYNTDDLHIAPLSEGDNKPVIQYYIVKPIAGKWLVGWTIPDASSSKCIYIPKVEYDNLPDAIKKKCKSTI